LRHDFIQLSLRVRLVEHVVEGGVAAPDHRANVLLEHATTDGRGVFVAREQLYHFNATAQVRSPAA
jgi:hypothetical protein